MHGKNLLPLGTAICKLCVELQLRLWWCSGWVELGTFAEGLCCNSFLARDLWAHSKTEGHERWWLKVFGQFSSSRIWVKTAPDSMLTCHQFGWVINLYTPGCLLMFKFLLLFIYLNPTHFLYILNNIHWFESVFQYHLYLIQRDE